ncbi:MAG TPA: type VI secretion system accessory protein TagJ [Verrucomicrobiae bacterium]
MIAADLVRSGRLAEALEALQQDIRQKPDDQGLRIFLFQLDCVLGRFEKALGQLQLLAALDAETMLMAQVYRQLIGCELLRREVFAGTRTPVVFGEPSEWMGFLIQSATLTAQQRFGEAAQLRSQAFDAAPATPGKVDGKPFEWIADADSRLGPVIEAILDGKYYWVPFCRLSKVEIGKPVDLRDAVWVPSQFTWTNGGIASGFIPVRYSGTEATDDDALRLARKTTWNEAAADCYLGCGQRMLSTDAGEYPLLDCRVIELSSGP